MITISGSSRTKAIAAAAAIAGLAPLVSVVPATAQVTREPAVAVAASAAHQSARPGTRADGRLVYRAAFFAQGALGHRLASHAAFAGMRTALSRNNTAKARKQADQIMDALSARHPGFFATFSRQVRSGDPYQVETALRTGSTYLHELAKPNDNSPMGAVSYCVSTEVAAAAVLVVVVAANSAAVANAVVVVNGMWFWMGPPRTEPRASSSLGREEVVAEATTLLRAH